MDITDSLKCVYGFLIFTSLFIQRISQETGRAEGKDLQPFFGLTGDHLVLPHDSAAQHSFLWS